MAPPSCSSCSYSVAHSAGSVGQGAREAVLSLDLGAHQLHGVLAELTAGRAPPQPCAVRSTGSRTAGGENRFPLGKTYFRLHGCADLPYSAGETALL